MTALAAETVGRRMAGERPSRTRALVVACIAAVATGTMVYRLLRSGDDAGDEGTSPDEAD